MGRRLQQAWMHSACVFELEIDRRLDVIDLGRTNQHNASKLHRFVG